MGSVMGFSIKKDKAIRNAQGSRTLACFSKILED